MKRGADTPERSRGIKHLDPVKVECFTKDNLSPILLGKDELDERGNIMNDIIKLLLQEEHLNVNCADLDGNTAIMTAAKSGKLDIMKCLLQRQDIKLDLLNNDGRTLLIVAASRGHDDVVEFLLQRAIPLDINQEDYEGTTALNWAAKHGHVDTVRILLQRPDINVSKSTPLVSAAQEGEEEFVSLLLGHEFIDVNQKRGDGVNTLLMAAKGGHEHVFKCLLGHKDFDIHQVVDECDGENVLMLAVRHNLLNVKILATA